MSNSSECHVRQLSYAEDVAVHTADDVDSSPPAPPVNLCKHKPIIILEEFPEPPTTTKKPKTTTASWEDEDLWEKKFVIPKEKEEEEEFPEITSGGGLFGISSGVGVGVPGVGPIGISSGLGIGR
ncbi:hypothetical protein Q1695_011285 [Nippostrongylus brasiliensis]|nr:hypothetical protein Q1695_011285 [Nippostrongylus brasiliensis]